MFLLVGLGNPGKEYENNRHNIGFMAVDAIIRRHNFSPERSRFHGLLSEGRLGSEKVLALKPQTFMNRSGISVSETARFYKIPLENIIVLYDELDLAPGKTKLKTGGGAAGHNGIRSIDQHLGNAYTRLRIGIGHPGDKARVTGHVLGNFAKTDYDWLDKLLDAIAAEAPLLIKDDKSRFLTEVARAMTPPRPAKQKPSTTQPE
ncbi:MAG: aminoacyl-tRNA hydrolase [Kordiimonas sp.]|nr:aminoacyl-tRNA hydrolase [Kordiimonas sp.]|tara:strand:- start:493 stop:1104 length:612 start_codon:yes stop_codon:yes gene_type:complete